MERDYFKRIASAFLSVMLVLTSVSIAPAAQVSDTVQTQSVSTRKYANIVVFVDFKDTTHEHEKTELGKCYKEDPKMRSTQERLSSMFLTFLMGSLMSRILFHSMTVRIIR